MQVVDTSFHTVAQGQVIPLSWGLSMSFDKAFDDDITFAQYDISTYDGDALYAPTSDSPINFWDYYEYLPYGGRVLTMEWTREIDFPYSVSAAMADFTVNNFDDYFTPESGSPIDEFILPKRPLRLFAGYANASLLQQFVGITEKTPIRDENSKLASFHATDFLTEIFTLELNETIAMQNVSTDVVLEAIFTQFGLNPTSYVLSKGRNIIKFLFFEKGKNAGEIIRDLMQAEGGNLWIDEQGIIRFEERLLPVEEPVMVFDDTNVIDIHSTGDDGIINYVKISSEVREVQSYQTVFSNAREPGTAWTANSSPFVIPANSSRPYPADLQNPCLTAESPTLGELSNVSWFTAVKTDGTRIASDISVTGTTLNTNQFIIFIENNNSFPIEIDQMQIWGQPAKVTNNISYKAKDQTSIDKFEEQVLDINNNFFGDYYNCDSFGETIIDAYKDHNPVIEMSVKGDFSLQNGDVVQVNARSYDHQYKITAITQVMSPYSCTLKARRYNPRVWARYDITEYDSLTDVIAP